MALVAQRTDVLRLIFKAGSRLVAAGIVIGMLAGLGAAELLRSRLDLFQVTTADPVSFLGVMVLLGGVALVAHYLPVFRATRVDPIVALRYE